MTSPGRLRGDYANARAVRRQEGCWPAEGHARRRCWRAPEDTCVSADICFLQSAFTSAASLSFRRTRRGSESATLASVLLRVRARGLLTHV